MYEHPRPLQSSLNLLPSILPSTVYAVLAPVLTFFSFGVPPTGPAQSLDLLRPPDPIKLERP